jgi:hypothetical protein
MLSYYDFHMLRCMNVIYSLWFFNEQKSDIIIHLEGNIVIQMKYDIIQGHPCQVSR